MKTTNSFSSFELAWRFDDAKFNKLPPEELSQLQPNTPEVSRELWSHYVSNRYTHINQFSPIDLPGFFRLKIDWNEKEKSRELIKDAVRIINDPSIIFFWSPSCSAKIHWSLFLKYWDDFCYPDDDNNVIVLPEMKIKILYTEEFFLLPTSEAR
jgi:hypothetical protein